MYSLSRDIQQRLFRPKTPNKAFTDEEILRWLRKFKYDSAYSGPRRVPIARLCEYAGVDPHCAYKFMNGRRGLHDVARMRLTVAIMAVQDGLRWDRKADHRYYKVAPQYNKVGEVA